MAVVQHQAPKHWDEIDVGELHKGEAEQEWFNPSNNFFQKTYTHVLVLKISRDSWWLFYTLNLHARPQ